MTSVYKVFTKFCKRREKKEKKKGTKERRGETGWDRTHLGVLLLGRQLDAAAGAGRGGKGLVEGRRDEKTREESLFSPDEPSLAAARSQSAAPVSRRVPSPHLFGGSFPLVRLLSINDYFKSAETACNKSARKSAFELFFLLLIKNEQIFSQFERHSSRETISKYSRDIENRDRSSIFPIFLIFKRVIFRSILEQLVFERRVNWQG